MKFLSAPLALLAFVPLTVSAAIDPSLLNLVTDDTQILAGVQVQKAFGSPFGQYLLSKMAQNANAQKFTAGTGFNPKNDLSEVLILSNGQSPNSGDRGTVLLKGRFDPSKFAAVATATGAAVSDYSGVQIITPANGKGPSAAFLDTSILVVGDSAHIQAVINRHNAATTYSSALADKASATSNNYDAWFASVTPVSNFVTPPANGSVPASVLNAILEESGGIQFGSTSVNFTGEGVTRTAQDAQTMARLLQLLSAMIQSNQNANAQAGVKLLSGANIVNDGTTIRVTLSIPEQQLEQMLQANQANPRAMRRR